MGGALCNKIKSEAEIIIEMFGVPHMMWIRSEVASGTPILSLSLCQDSLSVPGSRYVCVLSHLRCSHHRIMHVRALTQFVTYDNLIDVSIL